MSAGSLTRRRRMLVLVICSMSLLIVGLDVTIVNVALPSIRRVAACLGERPAVDRSTPTRSRSPAC